MSPNEVSPNYMVTKIEITRTSLLKRFSCSCCVSEEPQLTTAGQEWSAWLTPDERRKMNRNNLNSPCLTDIIVATATNH